MRRLIYVPIIHTSADLGSIAKDVAKRGIANLGEDIWKEHGKTVEGFWDAISNYFDCIDVKNVKIYQDGMVADGELGQKIVEETAKAGSKNYQLVSRLLERGAILVKTEDLELVKEEYNRLLAITQATSIVQKIVELIRYKFVKKRLLNKRDDYITRRIEQTLEEGERAILFIGAFHRIKNRLPRSIQIREAKDTQKLKEYQKLLPFHSKHRKHFDELGKYLVSKVDAVDAGQ
jgi:hypothetical protein